MIKSFRHKGLKPLFMIGHSSKIRYDLQKRALRRLDVMDAAKVLDELNIPGFDFHRLEGKPKRYSIHVNGPFFLTFEWQDGDIYRIDLENYH
ncbi:MAG: type II toxin-antitoxin system RelE/ParE family toxin [Mariprofundaceae bacterium]|nr:type II toxin-antitoxin system RelE/ParE family toxin [Mariprofundaceae bacterium]